MTALPAAADFTGASITEAQFKTAISNQRAFLSELLGTDGGNKVAAATALGAILCGSLDKSGAYTVVAADKGKVINCTGTWTLSVTAAATLGDGFGFAVWNNGTGTITIDPSGSEQIDGATTKALAAGKLAIVYCDGVKFVTVGSVATGAGSGLDADLLDGYHANNLPYAAATYGTMPAAPAGNTIGSIVAATTEIGTGVAPVVGTVFGVSSGAINATRSGGSSSLYYVGGLVVTGSWKALGGDDNLDATDIFTQTILFQKVA